MKKTIAMLLAAAMILMLFAGCGSSNSTSSTQGTTTSVTRTEAGVDAENIYAPYVGTELTFLRHSGYEADWMAQKAAEFYEISGIKVTIEQIAYSELKNKMMLDISSPDGAYDMVATTEYWLSEFSEGNWLADMNQFINNSALCDVSFDVEDIAQSVIDANTVDGKLLAMPWKFNGQLLAYRSDLIDTPPTTWDEYLALAKQLTEGNMVGVSLPLSLNSLMDIYLNLLYQAGGSFLSEDNKVCNLDTPEAKKALEFLIELNQYTTSGATNNQWPEASAVFQQGNAAMYPTITSQLNNLVDPEKSTVSDCVGYAELPGQVACLTTWGVGISSNCKAPEAAWLFIEYMLNPENTKELVIGTAGADIPVRSSLLLDEELNTSYASFKYMNELVSIPGHTWAYPKTTCTSAIMEALAVHVQNALLGSESTDDALANAKTDIEKLLNS